MLSCRSRLEGPDELAVAPSAASHHDQIVLVPVDIKAVERAQQREEVLARLERADREYEP